MRVLYRLYAATIALGLAASAQGQSLPAPSGESSKNQDQCVRKRPTLNTPRNAGDEDLPPSDPRLFELYEARKRFEEAAAEYRGDIHELITGKYLERRDALAKSYDKELALKGNNEKERRAIAIAYFEDFIATYPNHPAYTPGAMYRLADLYFERDNLDYLERDALYQSQLAQEIPGIEEQPLPRPDYSDTIRVFEDLIARFPDYENIDGAYFLLGYCLGEMDRTSEELVWYRALIRDFPNSRFAPISYLKLGDALFAASDFAGALDAYLKLAEYGEETPYYSQALYKLAWSYYRLGAKISLSDPEEAKKNFELSILRFRDVLDYYESQGNENTSLKKEALEYVQIDLTEDWDGDGLPDWESDPTQRPVERAKRYLDPKKPYTHAAVLGAADLLLNINYNQEAIELYRYAVDIDPLNPLNPRILAKVVEALEREGRGEEALAVREEISNRFGLGSEWASKQDSAALDAAASLAEEALIRSATEHHQRGQEIKERWELSPSPELFSAWQQEYALAAELYKRYLDEYSTSQNAYELSFFYAECLFWSGRFLEAAEIYTQVRDSTLGDFYFEEAAYSIIVALESQIKVDTEAGTMQLRETPPSVADGIPAENLAQPFPDLVEKAQQSREFVIQEIEVPCSQDLKGKIPLIHYAAALTYYNYGQFEEARRRFDVIIQRYPGEKVALDSAKLLVDSYRMEGNILAQKEAADKYLNVNLVETVLPPDEQRAIEDQLFGVDYQYARQLIAEEKYEEAAALLIKLVEQRPDWELVPKALNDAAVSYELAKRYDSATKYYERLAKEYPQSEFAANAVYRVGINAERFFEFDKAVSSYLTLIKTYKDFDELKRYEALLAIATIKENNREYAEAAKYYEQLHDDFQNSKLEKASPAAALFKAAEVRQKGALYDPAIKTYKRFLSLYNNKAYAPQVLKAHVSLAEIAEARKKPNDALKEYKATEAAYVALGVAPGDPGSEYAAQASFILAEQNVPAFEKISIKTKDAKKAKKLLDDKTARFKDLRDAFTKVTKYKSNEWSLAAFYRIGTLWENLADTFYNSNPFPEFSEEFDQYEEIIYPQVVAAEAEAIKNYTICYDTGRDLKIQNEWTEKALQKLNKFKGSEEYPLPKPARPKIVDDASLGAGVR